MTLLYNIHPMSQTENPNSQDIFIEKHRFTGGRKYMAEGHAKEADGIAVFYYFNPQQNIQQIVAVYSDDKIHFGSAVLETRTTTINPYTGNLQITPERSILEGRFEILQEQVEKGQRPTFSFIHQELHPVLASKHAFDC